MHEYNNAKYAFFQKGLKATFLGISDDFLKHFRCFHLNFFSDLKNWEAENLK